MNKLVYVVFGVLLVLPGSLRGQEALSPTETNKKLTFFYQNPDSLTLKAIIFSMATNKEVQEQMPPTATIGFFTSILLNRNSNSNVVARELKKYTPGNQLFAFILSMKETRDTLMNWNAHSAEVNDIIWSAYFGTGSTKYLDRLISELNYLQVKDSLDLLLAAHTARWSLSSNARQHKAIGEYLWQKANNAEGDIRKALFELLQKEPATIRDEFVALLKEMKGKGLLPSEESGKAEAEPELVLEKVDKSNNIYFRWNDHRVSFDVEARSIKEIGAKGFFDIDSQIVQFSTVKIPDNIDLTALNGEKEIAILKGYVQYEMQYFQNELKVSITDLKIDTKVLNHKNFVRWEIHLASNTGQQVNSAEKQIYYTTLCLNRVVSINSPVMPKDELKNINRKIEMIAKTIRIE